MVCRSCLVLANVHQLSMSVFSIHIHIYTKSPYLDILTLCIPWRCAGGGSSVPTPAGMNTSTLWSSNANIRVVHAHTPTCGCNWRQRKWHISHA